MAVINFDNYFEKQPSEQKTIRAEFADVASNWIVTGYTFDSVEVKVFDSTGADITTTMVEGTPSIDAVNFYVFVTLKNGTDGKEYTVRFKTTWKKAGEIDQIDEKDLLVRVKQKGFA